MQWCEHWKVVEQPLACLSRWYLLLFDMASCDLLQVFYCQFPGPGASKGSGSTLARLCWWGNFHAKSQRPAPRGNSLGHHETYKLFRKWKINVCGQVCSGQHVYIWHIVSMIIYCILIEYRVIVWTCFTDAFFFDHGALFDNENQLVTWGQHVLARSPHSCEPPLLSVWNGLWTLDSWKLKGTKMIWIHFGFIWFRLKCVMLNMFL